MEQLEADRRTRSGMLANFRVFESDDRDASIEHFRATLAEHNYGRQQPSLLQSFHSRTRLGDAWINLIGYQTAIEMAGTMPADTYFLSLILDGECILQCTDGQRETARPGDVVVINAGEEFSVKTDGSYSNLAFQIQKDSLSKTLATEMDSPLPSKLIFESGCVRNPSLARFMTLCCAEIDERGVEDRWEAVGASYLRTFHTLLLDGVSHSLTSWMKQGAQSTAAPYYVRRAEEFMLAHASECLTLHDIAAAAGIGVRSLHNGFRHFRGQTPMGYLKTIRLVRVREELNSCKDRDRTVTQIALENGFNHVSKFAQDYRNRFGELPSHALRK